MRFGKFEIFVLSDGLFELKDHFMHELGGESPGKNNLVSRGKSRLLVGINPVLIRDRKNIILCDTGLGTKHREQACAMPAPAGAHPSVKEQIQQLGIRPEEVSRILLTHMHFDHAGGLTCLDDAGDLILTYPNARVFVQAEEWEEAQQALYKENVAYRSENWGLYQDSAKMNLIDGDEEILPGILLRKTNGHTRGHQIIEIDGGDGHKAGVFGDLIPTPTHFTTRMRMKFDYDPNQSKKMRETLVQRALQEKWLLFFYHAPRVKAGFPYARDHSAVRVKRANFPDLYPVLQESKT